MVSFQYRNNPCIVELLHGASVVQQDVLFGTGWRNLSDAELASRREYLMKHNPDTLLAAMYRAVDRGLVGSIEKILYLSSLETFRKSGHGRQAVRWIITDHQREYDYMIGSAVTDEGRAFCIALKFDDLEHEYYGMGMRPEGS